MLMRPSIPFAPPPPPPFAPPPPPPHRFLPLPLPLPTYILFFQAAPLPPSAPASASEKVCVTFLPRALRRKSHARVFRRLPPPHELQARATFLLLLKAATSRSLPIISRWTQRVPARETACNLPLLMPLNCSAGVGCILFCRVCVTASAGTAHPFTGPLVKAMPLRAIFC